jgi:hypothetical protein
VCGCVWIGIAEKEYVGLKRLEGSEVDRQNGKSVREKKRVVACKQ